MPIHVRHDSILLIKHQGRSLAVEVVSLWRYVVGHVERLVRRLVLHPKRLLRWRVNLKLRVVCFHREIGAGLLLHSVHHLGKVRCIYVVELLLILLLVFTVEVF